MLAPLVRPLVEAVGSAESLAAARTDLTKAVLLQGLAPVTTRLAEANFMARAAGDAGVGDPDGALTGPGRGREQPVPKASHPEADPSAVSPLHP